MTSGAHRTVVAAWAAAVALALGSAETHADVEKRYRSALGALEPDEVLIVEFRADWCGPCRYLEKHVFPDARVRAALKDVSFLRVDTETAGGERLGQRYDVRALPTFLVVDREGVEVERHTGISVAMTPERFIEFLQASRDPDAVERKLIAAAGLGSADGAWQLAEWYESRGNLDEALRYYDETARRDPDDRESLGARAAWEASRLRRAMRLRREVVAEALAFADRFPGHHRATSALLIAAYSGLHEADDLAPRIAAHIHALDRLPELEAVVYLSLHVGAVGQARAAANKLVQLFPSRAQRFSANADVLVVQGAFPAARREAAHCAERAVKQDRPLCEELMRRLDARQPAPMARYLNDRAQLFFLNMESPGSAGDRARLGLLQSARFFELGERRVRRPVIAAAKKGDEDTRPARRHGPRNLTLMARFDRGNIDRTLAAGRYRRVLIRRGDVSPSLLLEAAAGGGSGGSFAFESAAMLGFAALTGPAVIGVYAGGGASGVGDALPGSTYVPTELSVSVDGASVGGLAWVRAHFLMGAERRRRGARNGPGDELSLGLGLRISLGLDQEILVGASREETLDGASAGLWSATRF